MVVDSERTLCDWEGLVTCHRLSGLSNYGLFGFDTPSVLLFYVAVIIMYRSCPSIGPPVSFSGCSVSMGFHLNSKKDRKQKLVGTFPMAGLS